MYKQLCPIRPVTNVFGVPEWYHTHGRKILIRDYDPENRVLKLASNVAEIEIRPHHGQGWGIKYHLRQPDGSVSEGNIWLSERDLRAAFRISNEFYEMYGASVIREHGGDVAHEDKYIRFEKYLNMPGPGTGNDGDPNVSIWVDDDIKEAVEHLLGH